MRTKEQLREQFKDIIVDDAFRQITEYLSSSPVFVKNEKGQFIFANALFLSHCKTTDLDDILGKTDYDYFPDEMADLYVLDDQLVLESSVAMFNRLEIVPDANGLPQWQVTHKLPLYNSDNEVCGIIGTFEEPLKSTRKFPKINALVPCLQYIEDNYGQRINIDTLAKVCKMSTRTFYRNFKENFNITPQQYLQKHRIMKACQQISSHELSLSEIAQNCGFYDHSHFTREFKKHMKINPSEFLLNIS